MYIKYLKNDAINAFPSSFFNIPDADGLVYPKNPHVFSLLGVKAQQS